jgi:hypothetical protein
MRLIAIFYLSTNGSESTEEFLLQPLQKARE